jgi:hypothetical protein
MNIFVCVCISYIYTHTKYVHKHYLYLYVYIYTLCTVSANGCLQARGAVRFTCCLRAALLAAYVLLESHVLYLMLTTALLAALLAALLSTAAFRQDALVYEALSYSCMRP